MQLFLDILLNSFKVSSISFTESRFILFALSLILSSIFSICYRIMLVRLEDGQPVSYEPFAEGWLQGESVSGRPVDLLVLDDGSMLVSDDLSGKLYRITYEEPLAADGF